MSHPDSRSACPCCGGGQSAAAFAVGDRNRRTTGDLFHYRRCAACGTIWLQDVPSDLAAHYPADYHDFPSGAALERLIAEEAPRLALVRDHVASGRLVEIGPSQGAFSAAAQRSGFDVTALEMDAECCAFLRDPLGVEAIQTADPVGALAGRPESAAIVMWHVIEHLPDPGRMLRTAAENLRPGGVLALATPNPRGIQARLLGRRWLHVDAPRHLTLMPLAALDGALGRLGLVRRSATTTDPIGLFLNRLGWERSLVAPPTLRDAPRGALVLGTLGSMLRPVERRGLHGATYTAVFQKQA